MADAPNAGGNGENGTGAQQQQQQGAQGGAGTGNQSAGSGSTGSEREKFLEQELARVRNEAAERRVKLNEFEEQQRKRDESVLAEQKKFEELASLKSKEVEDLKKQLADAEKLRGELEKLQTARRSELISRLPEGLRAKETYKTLPIEILEEVVKDLGTVKPGASPGTRDGAGTPGADPYEGKKLSDLSEEQQVQLMQTNRPLFDKMLAEFVRPR